MDQIVGNVKGAWLAYYNELNPLPFAQLVNGCCVVLALLLFQTSLEKTSHHAVRMLEVGRSLTVAVDTFVRNERTSQRTSLRRSAEIHKRAEGGR